MPTDPRWVSLEEPFLGGAVRVVAFLALGEGADLVTVALHEGRLGVTPEAYPAASNAGHGCS